MKSYVLILASIILVLLLAHSANATRGSKQVIIYRRASVSASASSYARYSVSQPFCPPRPISPCPRRSSCDDGWEWSRQSRRRRSSSCSSTVRRDSYCCPPPFIRPPIFPPKPCPPPCPPRPRQCPSIGSMEERTAGWHTTIPIGDVTLETVDLILAVVATTW
jgi:hypothetical protein